jgi:hypothetical protein
MMWLRVWLGCRFQVHKVVISSQYQLNLYFCTHKHLAHPHMSLVRYVVGAAILSSVPNQHNQLQLGFCMRGVFALESHSQGLLPHPYVAHCISSIFGFAMDNQHTCTRCWRVKPMSIGMLHDVAKGLAGVSFSSSQGGNIQSISTQLLLLHSQTPCHPHMSLVRYVVGAAILSSVPNLHNQLQLRFCMRGVFALESHSQGLLPHPYVAHCIVGFAMDNQHTCTRCWRVKPMSIGMLHDVAKGLAGVSFSSSQGGNIQSISTQLLLLHSQTPCHPHMSLVRYVVGAAILSSVPNLHNQLQLRFCMRGVFALESHSQGLLPHPYVAHCIVGFAMDNQHTCTRCWRVKPMSIGMLHDVAKGLAGVSFSSSQGGNIQSISTQLLLLHSQTPCHPHMSLVRYVVGAAILSSVPNQHNQLQSGFSM